jgi:TonB-dependent SusC/RagA subfamily outer membrane receptor
MPRRACRLVSRFVLVSSLMLGASLAPAVAQGGSVGGRVVDEETRHPLAGAQVVVQGTNRGTLTDASGRFLIPGVSGAQVTLAVNMLGFRRVEQVVSVGSTNLEIGLRATAIELDELVVTGTAGETSRRALGTTVSTVDAEDISRKAPVTNLSELLNGRAAGVTILSTTGMIGGGNRVRIRGASSFSLSNEPLIYIDGVRVNNDQSTGPVNQAFGSRSLSRWNDINPEDIESIEVIKGPAAATLYGTEASNGVIQIITKKGRMGTPEFNVTVKQGANWFANPEGRLWENYGVVDGTVQTIDIVELERSRGNEIWRTGHVQEYDVSASGGAERVRYYVAGTFENSTGADPDNSLRHWGGRVNVVATPSEYWDITGHLGYRTGRTNLGLEAGGGGLTWTTYFASPTRLDGPRRGFWSGTPESYIALWDSWQDLNRTTVGATVNHRPFDWFSQRLTVGQDLTREQDNELMHHDPQWVNLFSFADRGYKEVREHNVDFMTADYSGTVRLPVNDALTSSSSFGGQVYRRFSEIVFAYGEAFPVPGLTSISATTQGRNTTETSVENVTVGVYFQEQLAWKNRLFLTAAVRADDNSAFGEEFDLVTYPKLSGSWVISEEPFWNVPSLNTLKLRAAYGESGQQPEAFAAIRTFNPVTGPNDVGTVTPANLGNPALGPERGKEVELGFDAGLLDDRVGVEVTYYDKRTTDAILLREIAPSTGFSGNQFVNAGEIRNTGVELLVRGQAWSTPRHGLDLSFNIASNDNEVTSLGDVTDENFISAGTFLRHQIGYPVGSWFSRKVVSAELDANGRAQNLMCDDGSGGSIPCAGAPNVFLGRTVPKVEGGLNATLRLFDDFEVFGQLDFKTGFSKLDGNYRVRCFFFSLCRENHFPAEFDPVDIAEIQAAGRYGNVLIDDASFTKLRELSLGYTVPSSLARRLGATRASVRLAGRNLLTWSDYMGLEPESTFNGGSRGGNHSLWEQNVMPQLAQFVASINLTF